MKTYRVTIAGCLCYTAAAQSSFDLYDDAVDMFGVCSISIVGVK